MSQLLVDEAATIALAENLYNAMPENKAGWTVLLTGELGAGKSTFARAFIKFAGHIGPVPSPTYTLIEPYDLPAGTIYHIDLYRVSGLERARLWISLGRMARSGAESGGRCRPQRRASL
jgi:tRNA threonylcarbamoyladenosine biosynthesis protein TsaE